jgi:8-oxo-dGTP pyrophosphatase MutT (NUDIX family)
MSESAKEQQDHAGEFLSSVDQTRRKGGAPSPQAVPRDAATVILVREPAGRPFEVFLMRRHKDQDFMGGAYVFPGGRLDEEDCDPDLAALSEGLSPEEARRRLQEEALPPARALGLFLAALRETFEEAGILLARDSSGKVVEMRDGADAGRFASYRLALHDRRLTLAELARKENLRYALDLLFPYAHWITPEVEIRRFDTRFFVARQPDGQWPVHDTIEMTKSVWVRPAEALERYEAGEILLMPPTLKTLDELSRFRTAEDLFEHVQARKIEPLLPQAFSFEGGYGIRLPYDPQYTIASYKLPPRPGEPSRILLRDGRWRISGASD